MEPSPSSSNIEKRIAFHFIILLGVVSLFGDITYEGARSVTGPFLLTLGANAAIVGLVAGVGESIGYALRLVSGLIADRTKAYWVLVFIGYGLILSIPLLALANIWQVAAIFIILERTGKAIRTPARDTILSHATKKVGRGWGFGIHEALDQVGAFAGPLVFSAVFFLGAGFKEGFTILWIPAILTLFILALAKKKVPSPEKLEAPSGKLKEGSLKTGLPGVFWWYSLFIFLAVAGFASFPLISFHFKNYSIFPISLIPLLYAVAMGVDALMALADLIPLERRGFAYGIFNTLYGVSWLFGGVVMGLLYEVSLGWLILFGATMEIACLPAFFLLRRKLS